MTTSHRRLTATVAAVVGLLATALLAGAPPATASPDDAVVRVTVVSRDGAAVSGIFAGLVEKSTLRTDQHGVAFLRADTSWDQVCAYADPASPLGGPTGFRTTCVAIAPVAAETTRVRIVMATGAAFGGRVTDARTGAPVAGAQVAYYLGSDGLQVVRTGSDGTYLFRSLVAGGTVDTELLSADADPSRTARWGYATWLAPTSASYPLRAGVVTTDPGLDPALVPNVRVTGTVTDPAARPVAGTRVTVRVDDATTGTTTSNAQGAYLFVVPWDSTAPVCAKVAPSTTYPDGLARQFRGGLFRHGIEARADFTLAPPA